MKTVKKCIECETAFSSQECQNRKFCSRLCSNKSWARRFAGKNRKTRTVHTCENCGREYTKNFECDNRAFCSKSCRSAGMSARYQGEKSFAWKGGLTPVKRKLRNTLSYRIIQKFVFELDDFSCQLCGHRGGKIEMHHIVPFHKEPWRVLDVGNLVTLCLPCHNLTKGKEDMFELELVDIRDRQLMENYLNS